jgi:hypothetical protein
MQHGVISLGKGNRLVDMENTKTEVNVTIKHFNALRSALISKKNNVVKLNGTIFIYFSFKQYSKNRL